MSNIYPSAEALIGSTPLVSLTRLGTKAAILAKLESFNPGGSAKDRIALAMLNEAEKQGLLAPGGTVIEPTSGNTGIGLAMMCALRGYKCIIVMPDSMSIERQKLLAAYGAQVVLTPGEKGMDGALDLAEDMADSIPGAFYPGQFVNPANPDAHYATTGPEIWADTDGRVDILVAGVGTGGTLSGTGAYLKEKNPGVQVVAVEPAGSPMLSERSAGKHGIQGIGAGFVPATLDTGIYDRVLTVTDSDAFAAARLLAKKEGILAGISSGAALHAAMLLADEPENAGKTIVTVLPDTGERYLSTDLF